MSAEGVALYHRLTGGEAEYAALIDREGVEVRAAPDADGCGLMGCHESEYLVRVRIEPIGKRFVCPTHAAQLLRRELDTR